MHTDLFRCPFMGQQLVWSDHEATSQDGQHHFPISEGIPDFYHEDESCRVIPEDEGRKWLDSEVMVGRDMGYRRHYRQWGQRSGSRYYAVLG